MAKFVYYSDPGVILLEAEHGEELSLEEVRAAAALDTAWAAKKIALAIEGLTEEVSRIATAMS